MLLDRYKTTKRKTASSVFLLLAPVYCLLATSLPGCGYSTQSLYPEQYRTVALPVFENRTFERGVEADLTEALGKTIEQRTPYRLARSASADTDLTGIITSVERRRLSRTADAGFPQEIEVSVRIDFEWRDRRTSAVIAERRGLEQVGRYVPARTTDGAAGEPFSVAQHAAVARLADDVVAAMRGEF